MATRAPLLISVRDSFVGMAAPAAFEGAPTASRPGFDRVQVETDETTYANHSRQSVFTTKGVDPVGTDGKDFGDVVGPAQFHA